ncbi:hypothetical protein Pcaca03_35360 [Pectobacterium carotovorum subsp. carotovorum]|uniref:Uncharacterized protein n=1 Tax=Pectobacterium carotovorum subsp. carotovorum TaxID=555 RepID=A0AAI9L3H4_PECCC|nr:hypothetical protein Pcaca03_35360 [Pectobacterium carotovorum subsp. carotovorum]
MRLFTDKNQRTRIGSITITIPSFALPSFAIQKIPAPETDGRNTKA